MLIKICVSVAAILFVLQGCVNLDRTVDRNVRLFDELAFGGPFDNDLTHAKSVVKWNGRIRVAVTGENTAKYRSEVKAQLDRISKLTGLPIEHQNAPSSDTNYLVLFSPDIGFAIRKDFVRCAVNVRPENGVITKVRIRISTVDAHRISNCIAHEIMHSLGFRYHSGLVRSILSPAHGEADFTRWDEIMLKTLYSDDLTAGQPRGEALKAARIIIEKVLSE